MPEDPAPTPEAPPAPKAEPAPAAPDQAGELKRLRQEISELKADLWSKVQAELDRRMAPPARKPRKLPGFKPGVFKGR